MSRTDTPREWLTVDEVGAIIRQSEWTIRRHVKRGELRAARLGAGPRAPLRIARAELDRFLGGSKPAPAPPATTSTSLDVTGARAKVIHDQLLKRPTVRHVDDIVGLFHKWQPGLLDQAVDRLIATGRITVADDGRFTVHPWATSETSPLTTMANRPAGAGGRLEAGHPAPLPPATTSTQQET